MSAEDLINAITYDLATLELLCRLIPLIDDSTLSRADLATFL
jgi:hypothetical protein